MMTAEQLKASILQMAMQGKLVEQRAEEGTGEDLIGNISKTNHFKPIKYTNISEIEKEYDIPGSWAWVQLENIATLYNGRAYKQSELLDTGKTPVLRVGNLFTSEKWYYSDLELDDNKYCESEDLLYSWSASFGPFIWRGGKVIYHYHIWKVEYTPDICRDYLYYYLLTETQRIKANGHGLAMIHVTKAGMEKILVPLPPLEEQKRIVAKIEELMPFVEQYAKASTRLNTLNASFPDQMKKSILQQAVMGKLVPQDPNDEPVSVLLKKIAEEKQKLIKEGKIKKQKALPAITEEEIPFDIPKSWKWVRLNEIIENVPANGFSPKGVDYQTDYKNLTLTATTSGTFKADAFKYVDITKEQAEKYFLKEDDILIQRSNSRELVGTACLYTEGPDKYIYPDLMMRIHALDGIWPQYLVMTLQSTYVRGYYQQNASGSSQSMPKINQSIVGNTLIPIPPLHEQKKIVQTVNRLIPTLSSFY